jgi:hypothetical protein
MIRFSLRTEIHDRLESRILADPRHDNLAEVLSHVNDNDFENYLSDSSMINISEECASIIEECEKASSLINDKDECGLDNRDRYVRRIVEEHTAIVGAIKALSDLAWAYRWIFT